MHANHGRGLYSRYFQELTKMFELSLFPCDGAWNTCTAAAIPHTRIRQWGGGLVARKSAMSYDTKARDSTDENNKSCEIFILTHIMISIYVLSWLHIKLHVTSLIWIDSSWKQEPINPWKLFWTPCINIFSVSAYMQSCD